MASSASSVRVRRAWLALAGICGGAYVVSAYAPPLDPSLVGEATLFARQFPTVPPAWIAGRLLALGLALTALFCATRGAAPNAAPIAVAQRHPVRPRLLHGAVAIAALLCVAGMAARHLGPMGQLLFVLALPLPTLCTYAAHRQPGQPRLDPALGLSLALFTLWVVLRLGWLPHDARAATPVDTWLNFKALETALARGGHWLTGRFEPGVSNLVHLLCGESILRSFGWTPTLQWIQAVNGCWLAVATLSLHALVARIAGPAAACVAVAAFLFSPATLMLPLSAMPLAIPIAFAVTLFLLFHLLYTRHSPSALVGLGTLGGASLGLGHTVPIAACLGLATAWLLLRRWRLLPPGAIAAAGLACLAIAIPLAPDALTLDQMRSQYLQRFVPWQFVEGVLLGQRPPLVLQDLPTLQRPWENAAAALLAPALSARTALRLWGDGFIEPLAAALALAGVLFALRRGGAPALRAPLVYALVAILPGLTSSYDRPSLIRVVALPAMLSILAAGGFAYLVQPLQRRHQWALAVGCCAMVIVSGTWIFDHVNPRIVAQSWVTIAIDATQGRDDEILLDFPANQQTDYLNVPVMAAQVPERARRTLALGEVESLRAAEPSTTPTFLWSPGQEAADNVTLALCRAWPAMRRFLLHDAAGISQALAASADPGWRPALAASRWRELPTCAAHADEPGLPKSTRNTPQARP